MLCDALQAVVSFLLGRAGVFADKAAETLFTNQLRTGGLQFDNLRTKRWGLHSELPCFQCLPVANVFSTRRQKG